MIDSFRSGQYRQPLRVAAACAAAAALTLIGACASKTPLGYGVGAQAEREMMTQQADKAPPPNTPGMYLGLIDQMQSQGLYFASLAHIDAYDKQYGASPDSILLRADALRMTGQAAAAANAYGELLKTPLAARGYRGLGLLAGAAGDFGTAAQQLQQAVQHAPTDPATLSDLGYARLRDGDIDGARVPLMQAAELDQKSPKIVANVVLYLLASGGDAQALAVMDQQQFTPEVRAAIRGDAAKIAAAGRAHARATPAPGATPNQGQEAAKEQGQARPAADARTVASMGSEPAPRLLQRFAQ
ncbi:pilus assembly protein [Burkholderia sp. SRS-W-2-2016]|uniref:tetratricopeptide repeat protein n=1 Tax=Burkholderia sp. SRS-W-2-2016 TaxID=1926878 RepID=UPI00094B5437|nr:tetratricopeptide repeat protein [Burkholderia sp. SRS-W-2-2016]OLL32049.1 pilus assembly protein [Burkholderia sp. SRS-W-2-2016]